MNKEIETLYKTLEAKDKIINTQALEIAELREENEKLTNLWLESQTKKRKAIEYLKHRVDSSKQAKYELLEILGDKEDE